MAQYNNLKTAIAAVIKQNGNNEITGDLLQQTLIAIVNGVGLGYQFMGVATPETDPGTQDARIFYIASQEGQYSNFGGVTLDGNQFALFLFAADWSSIVLDLPTKTYVDAELVAMAQGFDNLLGDKVDKIPGKGLSTNDLTDELEELIIGAFQKSNIVSELGDDVTKVLSQAAITIILESYAKTNGNYPEMTVGAAENLVGRGSVSAEINFRTAGGTADIGSGTAIIKKILGKTLAWNQLVENGNFATNTIWGVVNGTKVISNGEVAVTIGSNANTQLYQEIGGISGHKYYQAFSVKASQSGEIYNRLGYSQGDAIQVGTSYIRTARIATCPQTGSYEVNANNKNLPEGATYTVKDFIRVDLTLMFGAGNEPSTVEEFEAMFPLPYYAYNPGQLVSNRAMKLKTVGFNQWDEQWENGYFDNSTGAFIPASDNPSICSKNFIPVFAGSTYYIKHPSASSPRAYKYDANKNFLGYENFSDNLLTIPNGCAFIKFIVYSYGAGYYNNDICINLSWSGIRNGEYEPYWESEIDLNLPTLTGKKDGVGESVVVFPDGIPSAGSAQSEIEADGVTAHKRIGAIDLGNLNWITGYDSQSNVIFYTEDLSSLIKSPLNDSLVGNIICSIYSIRSRDSEWGFGENMVIAVNRVGHIYVNNYSYTDAAAFKAAMQGVVLYYELAEPETYILDEPVPMNYRVDDFGTEAKEPADTEQENGVYAPLTLMVQYAMNAVDTLRRLPVNYISKPSFDAFCSELATKLGAAINKNISIVATYNAEQEKYNYTITISDIEQQ